MAQADYRLSVRHHRCVDRALPGRKAERRAHINPIVTLAFRLMGKLDLRTSFGYVVAQLAGAILGSVPLLAWGAMGRSVAFGATFPGEGYSVGAALLGEVITTFAMQRRRRLIRRLLG